MTIAPLEFIRQVQREVSKVTWPGRKETIISTVVVMIIVVIMALFFLAVDQVLGFAIRYILGLGK